MGLAEPLLLERVAFLDALPLREDRSQQDGPRTDGALPLLLYLYPELREWLPMVRRLAIPLEEATQLLALARKNGTCFQAELLCSGLLGEAEFFRALAHELGLGYQATIDPDRLIVNEAMALSLLRRPSWHIPVKLDAADGATTYLIAPDRIGLGRMRALVERYPRISGRLRIAAPGALRRAVFERVTPRLAQAATGDLFDRRPEYSARIVANAWQGFLFGIAVVLFPAAIWIAPLETWTIVHIILSIFFLACVGLRFAALRFSLPSTPAAAPPPRPSDLPVYSVLVALYDEAEVVPGLVRALQRLDWPKTKLEIKLVCEADDSATLAALDALPLPWNMEVVRVPVGGPRTKPKALAYALPLASGEFVVLYDAEDSPDPAQLLQAWQTFSRSAPEVVCLQAPLEISNGSSGRVSRMFAFEYATLFRGLLPWLSTRRLLLPLGGTSNHFRRSALEEVGGWDPYNVTEDADLGVRLARFGYRTETIGCPTYEAAPDTLRTWLPQRTRWFKGWIQTWLVHMRDPFRLIDDLGFGSFLIAQILVAGMILSALAHPFLFLTGIVLALDLTFGDPLSAWKTALLGVDLVNIACGYVSFLLLGWQVLGWRERVGFWKIVLFTPVYWMMMSAAAWRAVWQLRSRPHLWEKTPHRPNAAADEIRLPADAMIFRTSPEPAL